MENEYEPMSEPHRFIVDYQPTEKISSRKIFSWKLRKQYPCTIREEVRVDSKVYKIVVEH